MASAKKWANLYFIGRKTEELKFGGLLKFRLSSEIYVFRPTDQFAGMKVVPIKNSEMCTGALQYLSLFLKISWSIRKTDTIMDCLNELIDRSIHGKDKSLQGPWSAQTFTVQKAKDGIFLDFFPSPSPVLLCWRKLFILGSHNMFRSTIWIFAIQPRSLII